MLNNQPDTYDKYVNDLKWLEENCSSKIIPGLERMQSILEALGNPEREGRFIHVAGTNGKGSTCAMLAKCLELAGYSVGLFTSPHLISWNERIQLNGKLIQSQDLAAILEFLKPHILKQKERPSLFEAWTLIALCFFMYHNEPRPDIIIWETGLGGRLDATNIVTPLLSIITNIGLDHQEWLGDTISEIASEKAGIIKAGVPVLCGETKPEAVNIIKAQATKLGCDFYIPDKIPVLNDISLSGKYQQQNAAIVIKALQILQQEQKININNTTIKHALAQVKWPGRFEIIRTKPPVILDGAHNPPAIRTIADELSSIKYDKLYLLVACMDDKADTLSLFQPLIEIADTICATEVRDNPRCRSAAKLAHQLSEAQNNKCKITYNQDSIAGYNSLIKNATEHDLILVTGSLFLIAEVRKNILKS